MPSISISLKTGYTALMLYHHQPVLLQETLRGLNVRADGVYADGTLGGGGHAEAVLSLLTAGRLIGVDRDGDAIRFASERLARFAGRFTAVRANYRDLPDVLAERGVGAVDGILLDLGLSSFQLDEAARGFSYQQDARLDMRMDDRQTENAADVLNRYSEQRLADIFHGFGEERYARAIARAVTRAREAVPIVTAGQLNALIDGALPGKARRLSAHSYRRVYQALRIQVNDELDPLPECIRALTACLKPGGRFAVITFHSLEDRIVKHGFRQLANPCVCPHDLPRCVCGKRPLLTPVTRKAVLPTAEETAQNPRAHSAKLRVAERTSVRA